MGQCRVGWDKRDGNAETEKDKDRCDVATRWCWPLLAVACPPKRKHGDCEPGEGSARVAKPPMREKSVDVEGTRTDREQADDVPAPGDSKGSAGFVFHYVIFCVCLSLGCFRSALSRWFK